MSRKRLDWNKYTWEDFEDICYSYASRKYNSSIYKVILTERRKDGGRDIVITNNATKEISWAECKHHKKSIGLDDLGKNVILAITNQINKIIFFSVSSITPNTKHEILTTAKIYGFDVLFLDGITLDAKIAEDKNILNTYFKESFNCFYPNKNSLCVEVCVDEFPNAYDDSFFNNLGYLRLQNGLEFYIHVFIKNNSDESEFSDINIKLHETTEFHLYSNNCYIKRIKTQCDDLVTIKGILLNTQDVISLPALQIEYTEKNKKRFKCISLGDIDGTKGWFVSLCGNEYLNCISKSADIAEKVIQGYTRILYIRGTSGSGKSRLLKEISNKMYQSGFYTVSVNAMLNTKNLFFRELIRQLLCLPHLNTHNMFNVQEFDLLLENCGIVFAESKIIHHYLWYNQGISPTLLGEFVIKCIIREKQIPKVHIQIDNIQCLDKQSQQILLYICSICLKMKTHLFLAFSLNTSVVIQSVNNGLINYLDSETLHEENGFVQLHQIHKLNNESKKHIVENCLKLSSDNYNNELQEIARKSGNLPLDVILFCKHLFDSGCISHTNNNSIINNSELFSSKLNSMPYTVSSLVKIRLNTIDDGIISKKKAEKLYQLILFFDNNVSINMLQRFSISIESIHRLIERLILSQNENGYISFYHDNYYRYISKKENFSVFTKRELKILLDYCKENCNSLNPALSVNEAKCLYYLNQDIDFQIFSEKLLGKLKTSFCYNEIILLSDFYTKVITQPQYKNKHLLFRIEKALAQMETTSFIEGIREFRIIESQIKESKNSFDIELIGKFYHHYVNSYTHSGNYKNAITVLQEFEKFHYIPLKYRFLIEDRYCLCFFSVGSLSKANEHIDKAIKIARKLKSDFWISTAYSDKAFNYFYNTNELSKIRYYFNKAIKYYNAKDDQTPYRTIEIEIQTALSFILYNKVKKANQHIEKAIGYAEERNYTYLLIPALNIKSYLLMLNDNLSEAIGVLRKALFLSEVFGSNKWTLTIFNSLGIAYSLSGDVKNAYEYFSVAIELLNSMVNYKDIITRFNPLVVNYATLGYKNASILFSSDEYYNDFINNKIIRGVYRYLNKKQDIHSFDINVKDYFPLTVKEYALIY